MLAIALSASALCKPIRASFYADKFEGRETASGQIFHQNLLTAASLDIPLGSHVIVENIINHKRITVLINDRGPFDPRFKLDLSVAAAKALGITHGMGWGWVCVKEIR